MLINQDTMDNIHKIQLEMMNDLIVALNKMQISYFFVHGSLLGAVRTKSFIPDDDDIDIAIWREDYDRLMREGNSFLDSNKYFLQNSINDGFPLTFGKMRSNNTAFIQPLIIPYNCNQGIYIDIFPIDFKISKIKEKLVKFLNYRIYSKFKLESKPSIKFFARKIITLVSLLIFPSYKKALKIREKILSSGKPSDFITITGGKSKEIKIPKIWFNQNCNFDFEDLNVSCPQAYENYLECIYGTDFLNFNPAEKRHKNNSIEISACQLDLNQSYKEYYGNK